MSEIRQLIWEGTLNLKITLFPNDSTQMDVPHCFFLKVHRNSYFPFYYAKILRYFKDEVLVPDWTERSDWWLEFEDVPLKWNLPIGLLHDTLTTLDPLKRAKAQVWELTLHYRNYPEEYILPLPDLKTLETHWVNQIKESCYIQHSTAKPIMVLSKRDSSDLWESVRAHNPQIWWSILPKFLASGNKMKHIPIRFHLTLSNKTIDSPIEPYQNGKEVTLGQALNRVLPELFPSTKNMIIGKPVLHGIIIPLATPLTNLYHDALYIDGFLHFSIILMS